MDRKQREEALNEVLVLKAMRHPYIITYRESFMEKKYLIILFIFEVSMYRYGLCRWGRFVHENCEIKRNWPTIH